MIALSSSLTDEFREGWAFSAMTTAFTMKGMKVTFTLRCSSTSFFTFSRNANSAVTSAWSMAVTWAALVWDSIMCFAVVRRIPLSGTRSTQPYRSNLGAALIWGVSDLRRGRFLGLLDVLFGDPAVGAGPL